MILHFFLLVMLGIPQILLYAYKLSYLQSYKKVIQTFINYIIKIHRSQLLSHHIMKIM